MKKELTIIEPICYLYPHREELVASHPNMKEVWSHSIKLLRENNSYLAPLLVDDIVRDKKIAVQTIDDLIKNGTGKSKESLSWFGNYVLESVIASQYGNLGCKVFDSIYHRDVLMKIFLFSSDWKWIVVHPISFQAQQSGMLNELWNLIFQGLDFSLIAQSKQTKTEHLRNKVRGNFLNHFKHIWIDKGEIVSETRPLYKGGKIIHQ